MCLYVCICKSNCSFFFCVVIFIIPVGIDISCDTHLKHTVHSAEFCWLILMWHGVSSLMVVSLVTNRLMLSRHGVKCLHTLCRMQGTCSPQTSSVSDICGNGEPVYEGPACLVTLMKYFHRRAYFVI